MRPRARLLAACALVILAAAPVIGYLKLGSRLGGQTVTLRWRNFPVRYFVTDRGVDGVTAQQFQTAVTRAFGTWHAVETATTSSQFVGFTQAQPGGDDDMTVIGYQSQPVAEPDPGRDELLHRHD